MLVYLRSIEYIREERYFNGQEVDRMEIMQNLKKDNCLSLIRIIAALQVFFGHMLEHLQLPIDSTIAHATYFFRGVPIFLSLADS